MGASALIKESVSLRLRAIALLNHSDGWLVLASHACLTSLQAVAEAEAKAKDEAAKVGLEGLMQKEWGAYGGRGFR